MSGHGANLYFVVRIQVAAEDTLMMIDYLSILNSQDQNLRLNMTHLSCRAFWILNGMMSKGFNCPEQEGKYELSCFTSIKIGAGYNV